MFRCVMLLATCAVASAALIAPSASADPEAEPIEVAAEAVPAPPDGATPPEEGPVDRVESSPPATTKSPDGWTLTVSAKDETQRVIQPLTTAVSTREYEVGGVFNAPMKGPEDAEPPEGSLGRTPGLGLAGLGTGTPVGIPTLLSPISGSLAVALKPGVIDVVPVTKKQFKGADPWVQITGFRVKIDGCVGESFIRSYAFLTCSTNVSDAILGYYRVTKKV